MSDVKWWVVRLKCREGLVNMGVDESYIEERVVWALTPEDAVAKTAHGSDARYVDGATVRATEDK